MPAFIKTKEDERLWAKAKARAKEEGHAEDWAYVTGIYKKMKGGKVAGQLDSRRALKLASRWLRQASLTEWAVYLFSDTGKTLFTKTFMARDEKDANRQGLKLVKPHLGREDAEDWVVEPTGR